MVDGGVDHPFDSDPENASDTIDEVNTDDTDTATDTGERTIDGPSDLVATLLQDGTLVVTWTPGVDDFGSCLIIVDKGTLSGQNRDFYQVNKDATSYDIPVTTRGVTYYISIHATSGDIASDGAAASVFVPDAPAAPSELTVQELSDTEFELAWTDNSDDETGFVLMRKVAGEESEYDVLATEILNFGDSDLVLTETPIASVEAPYTVDFTDTSATIPAETVADGEKFTLGFEPTTPGSFLRTFVINSNDPFTSPYVIMLSGICIAPEVSVSCDGTALQTGSEVDFGETLVGMTVRTKTVQIMNNGESALDISSTSITDSTHFSLSPPSVSRIDPQHLEKAEKKSR